jgi:hypothetical protein
MDAASHVATFSTHIVLEVLLKRSRHQQLVRICDADVWFHDMQVLASPSALQDRAVPVWRQVQPLCVLLRALHD